MIEKSISFKASTVFHCINIKSIEWDGMCCFQENVSSNLFNKDDLNVKWVVMLDVVGDPVFC